MGTGLRVLVADDNPRMRAMIRAVMQPVAASVVECADGNEAVRLHATVRPDLVLMDIEMAGVDGITATRAIRAADVGACVVIVTGHDDRGLRRAAESAGARGYVLKEDLLSLPAVVLRCCAERGRITDTIHPRGGESA